MRVYLYIYFFTRKYLPIILLIHDDDLFKLTRLTKVFIVTTLDATDSCVRDTLFGYIYIYFFSFSNMLLRKFYPKRRKKGKAKSLKI